MMKVVGFAVGLVLVCASAAAAQTSDTVGMIAGAMNELGESVGQAAFSGDSIFVTASGKVKLPAPLADSYFVNIQGKNALAVQAVRERDQRMAQVMDVARRLGITTETGTTSFTLEPDTEVQERQIQERNARMQVQMQLHPGAPFLEPMPSAPKVFIAKTSLRFQTQSSASLAAFLDALHADGVDEFSQGVGGRTNPFVPPMTNFMGFGSLETLDPDLWRLASDEALHNAQAQAQALAVSSGRPLGPVRQITVLTRSIENGTATESIAVRFGFAANH